jgi:hypothetical protein
MPDRPEPRDDRPKARCLCGKWFALRPDACTLVLMCKLCRREIVIVGKELKVDYR